MSELRDIVIEAHGGTSRWKKAKSIEGDMSITGGLWARKGWPGVLKAAHVSARTQSQWISYRPFIDETTRSVCQPDHTIIETMDGKVVKERHCPRNAFANHKLETRWDDLNLAYFSGYAMWNYLNTPYLFTLAGVRTEEIEPFEEDGERRRRLKVTFPDSIATHCSEQVFHIGDDGLIRRLDYNPWISAGMPTAHYLNDYRDFGGLKFATRRRAFRRNPDGTSLPQPVIVAIDITDIRLA